MISKKKKKKKGLRRNPKAFSGRNQKFEQRFFQPKTGDLQTKKKGLRRNPKAFSGPNQKLKRFFRPKTATFSSQKPALKSRVVNLGPVYTIPGSGFPGILDL